MKPFVLAAVLTIAAVSCSREFSGALVQTDGAHTYICPDEARFTRALEEQCQVQTQTLTVEQ